MERRRVDNEGVSIEYLTEGEDDSLTPVLFLPGFLSPAGMWWEEMEALRPRRTFALSLRGRGNSDAPATGYGFDQQLSDVLAVVTSERIARFAVVAWSRGVPFAIAAALTDPEAVRGLVLLDHPPVYRPLPSEWVDQAMGMAPEHPPAVLALQRESALVDLWHRLPEVDCPVLVLYGGVGDSLMSDAEADRYRELLPRGEVICFRDAGHDVRETDHRRFMNTLRVFLDPFDAEKA